MNGDVYYDVIQEDKSPLKSAVSPFTAVRMFYNLKRIMSSRDCCVPHLEFFDICSEISEF